MTTDDYYEILGLSRDASEADIKSAYKKAALKYHPDNTETGSEEMFKKVGEAYDVLKDPQKRSIYDQYGAEALKAGAGRASGSSYSGFQGAGFEDINDIFSSFFGGNFAGHRSQNRSSRPQRGQDQQIDLQLKFLDPLEDIKKKIRINPLVNCSNCHGLGAMNPSTDMQTCSSCNGLGEIISVQNSILGQIRHSQTCPSCKGKGKIIKNPCKSCKGKGQMREEKEIEIKIPAGIDDGSHLRLQGMGDAGPNGGPSGDIYVLIHIARDPRFERHAADIYSELEISYPQAVLGDEVEIDSIHGKSKLKIEAGTKFDSVSVLKSKGMPKLNRKGQFGDHYVKIKIDTPKKISKEERTLLEQLKNLQRPRT